MAPGTHFTRVRALNGCLPGATSAEAMFTITQAPGATRVIAVSGNLAFGAVAVRSAGGGELWGTLTVVSDATASTASIPVSGTGVSAPPPLPGLHV